MAVISNTGTVTPVIAAETDVVAIAPGSPLDNITVYFVGGRFGGGGPLELALYATVGGFRTRVAQAKVMGSLVSSIVAWQTIGKGDGQTELVDAGGTDYTVTVIDLSGQIGTTPREPVTITIAGVNEFDTVPDQNFGAALVVPAGTTQFLPTFDGYAQLMGVAIDQTNLPLVFVSISADCGPGSVLAEVVGVEMTGRDEDIAAVFRGFELPVATRYFVSVKNESPGTITVITTGVTHSVQATSGGAVVLGGDVIGPSAANTVIKWDNVSLLLVGAGNFGAPVDAGIPIYDLGLDVWRTFAITDDVTMLNTGVATVVKWLHVGLDVPTMGAPAVGSVPEFNVDGTWHAVPGGSAVTLAGDVTGPAGANTVVKWDNVPLLLVGAGNFGAPAAAGIPISSAPGGPWRTFAFSQDVQMLSGIPGVQDTTGIMTVTGFDTVPLLRGLVVGSFDPGAIPDAAIGIYDIGLNQWRAFALSGGATMSNAGLVTITPVAVPPLVGNVNGPPGANKWLSFMLPAANADVVVPATSGWYYVGVTGLTATHQVLLPAAPVAGEVVVVTDEDGSLLTHIFNIVGNGKNVEGVATFAMNAVYPGSNGSVALQYDGTAWFIFADYAKNATPAVVTLTGNTSGPSNSNVLHAFTIENVTATDVLAVTFVPADGEWYVGMIGIPAGGNLNVNIPVMPTGSKVIVKDEDGSLAGGTLTLIPAGGKTIDGAATYVMTAAQNGVKGSVTILMNGRAPTEWQLV